MQLQALVVASLAAAAAAQDTSNITGVMCGATVYPAKQVELAFKEGCRLYEADRTVGAGSYPHTFNNRENLNFLAEGPYQEFPIVKRGKFGTATRTKTGKKERKHSNKNPGADRVVFNPDLDGDCVYVGAMTHTGAEGDNGFVECKMQGDGSDDDDDDSAGVPVAPAWYVAATGLAAYWALGL